MQPSVVVDLSVLDRDMARFIRETKRMPKSANKNLFMRAALKFLKWSLGKLSKRPSIGQSGTYLGERWKKLKGRRSVHGIEVPLWGGFRQRKKTLDTFVQRNIGGGAKLNTTKHRTTGKLTAAKRADGQRRYKRGDKQLDKLRGGGMLADWHTRPEYINNNNFGVRIGSSKIHADVHAHGSKDGKTPKRNWYEGREAQDFAVRMLRLETRRWYKHLKDDIEKRK